MEIQIILRRLGICTTYKGYKATVLALTLALEDENRLNSITREIYTEVAKRLGSTPSAIEKNLRTVVQRAWRMNPGDLEKMAGYHLEFMPSVSEFLDILFNYIQRIRLSRKN